MTQADSLSPLHALSFPFPDHIKALLSHCRPAGSHEPIPVVDPSTGDCLAMVGQASGWDVDAAVSAARTAFARADWAQLPPSERAALLFRLADLLERHAGALAEIETLNAGIPIQFSRGMALPLATALLRYYAGWATKIHGESIPATPAGTNGAPTVVYTRREPVGVVAQIVPWNFPLGLAVLKIAPALAAGCTVILKPSEFTPLSALYLATLAEEAGFPKGVLNVVNGYGPTVGARLASHPGIDKISFTGSPQAGRAVLAAASGNLKRVSLELGGKSPVIIFDDADLELAIPGAAMAAFFLQGQNCMAGTRLLVHRKVHDRVIAGIESFAKGMTIGPAISPDTVIGPLISSAHRERVRAYIESGIREGAELVTGGRSTGSSGFFVEPTLFTGTSRSMRIVREEIFGPVIAAQAFDSDAIDDVCRQANDTGYGLSASVWTTNLSRAHRMAHAIQAGQVSVNCHGAVDVAIPFGGYKQSGWGREYGRDALDLYTETKAVILRV